MVRLVEAPGSSARVHDYLDDAEYAALQWPLVLEPDAGDVVPGSGGLRKLRWRYGKRGKRGGIRIICYWRAAEDGIRLLAIYTKNEETDIPREVLRRIRREIEE